MDESVRLLGAQQQLEKEADGQINFFGQSVSETIRTCLLNGMAKRAEKVRADFKVPDKRSVLPAFPCIPSLFLRSRTSARIGGEKLASWQLI